jgi:hypothetical protein
MLGAYDFVYNGSVLDNVFDPAGAMRNISKLLKPDGVAIHYEGVTNASNVSNAYWRFAPDWFFDYCALNDFADCQAYLCVHDNIHNSAWDILEWDEYTSHTGKWQLTRTKRFHGDAVVVVIAQNAPNATTDRTPIQNVYRPDHLKYIQACANYQSSKRREALRRTITPNFKAEPGFNPIGTIP